MSKFEGGNVKIACLEYENEQLCKQLRESNKNERQRILSLINGVLHNLQLNTEIHRPPYTAPDEEIAYLYEQCSYIVEEIIELIKNHH